MEQSNDVRDYNVGSSDYSKHAIQPWDIWQELGLNPWDADICKRILRKKDGEDPSLDYKKIKHICDERRRQITEREEKIRDLKELILTEYPDLTDDDKDILSELFFINSDSAIKRRYAFIGLSCDRAIYLNEMNNED